MDNHHDSSPERANGDEPILIFAVLFIVDHEVVLVTLEEGCVPPPEKAPGHSVVLITDGYRCLGVLCDE